MPLVVTVAQVRTRLNKTTTVDDPEITEMIDAAEAEYAEQVAPIASRTLRFQGGAQRLVLPLTATAVTAVAYTDGTAIAAGDMDFDAGTGILHWRYGTRGYFTSDVLVKFTVSVPAHHREAILADIAGYFAATQRGNSGGALPPGYEGGFEDRTTPIVLFPRIRALASADVGVA